MARVRWLEALADLVWPLACAGCGDLESAWCPACAGQLAGPAARTRPTPCPPGLPPAWTVAAYDGGVRRAVIAWKDEGRHDLTGPLSQALGRSALAALAAGTVAGDRRIWLVPMPSRPSARRARGGDPVRSLAVRAAAGARRGGWDLQVVPALRHRRTVDDQAGLDAAGRARNLAGALEVRPAWAGPASGTPCLLVDDVITTGASLAEAAAALRRAGAHPFGLAVVAATQRTGGTASGSARGSLRGPADAEP